MSTRLNWQTPTGRYHNKPFDSSVTRRKIARFRHNLKFVTGWSQYEQLELIKQEVPISDVSLTFLQDFRETIVLKN